MQGIKDKLIPMEDILMEDILMEDIPMEDIPGEDSLMEEDNLDLEEDNLDLKEEGIPDLEEVDILIASQGNLEEVGIGQVTMGNPKEVVLETVDKLLIVDILKEEDSLVEDILVVVTQEFPNSA